MAPSIRRRGGARCQKFLPNAIFRPTVEDVDPGIDHGNPHNLPETYQRQVVFYLVEGTIIVETSERHLYVI